MKNRAYGKVIVLSLVMMGLAGSSVMASPPQPATSDQIKELIAKADQPKDYDKADLVYILDESDVYVRPNGLARTKACQVIKVLTAKGVKAQSVRRFTYDPQSNRITIESARVHHKDGSVEEVPLSTIVDQPSKQRLIFWRGQEHLLSIPNLRIGDCIEIRTSKIGYNVAYLDGAEAAEVDTGDDLIPPMPGHWYEVTMFQGSNPIIKKRYSVHMPKDMPLQYEVYNGDLKSSLWFDADRHVYTFTAENIPAIKREPRMAADSDCGTKVVLATVQDWEAKSRWFFEANKYQFEVDDTVRAIVDQVTSGLTDEEDKIRACLHWSADNIRYCGTSRGPKEGYTLHTGIETLRDRAGVCKDKAGMMVTMLRALGYESYPAMTMAGSRIEAIPADQFNHCVTLMRKKDGTFRILDPTWVPLSREIWSSREALQGIVYGTPDGQPLMLTPYYEPSYNLFNCRSSSTISEDGTLVAQINMDLSGYPCTYFRRSMDKRGPEQRAAFEKALNVAPNVRIEQLSFTDPFDYSEDSKVSVQVSADRYLAGDGNVRMFHMPLMSYPLKDFLIPDLFYDVKAETRQHGMRMRATRLLQYEETVQLPPGWKIESVPEKVELDSPAASLSFEATPDGDKLTYRFEIALKQHIVPAEDYPGLKKAFDKMYEIAKEWIVCTTGETG